jgi:hypothetical protein
LIGFGCQSVLKLDLFQRIFLRAVRIAGSPISKIALNEKSQRIGTKPGIDPLWTKTKRSENYLTVIQQALKEMNGKSD